MRESIEYLKQKGILRTLVEMTTSFNVLRKTAGPGGVEVPRSGIPRPYLLSWAVAFTQESDAIWEHTAEGWGLKALHPVEPGGKPVDVWTTEAMDQYLEAACAACPEVFHLQLGTSIRVLFNGRPDKLPVPLKSAFEAVFKPSDSELYHHLKAVGSTGYFDFLIEMVNTSDDLVTEFITKGLPLDENFGGVPLVFDSSVVELAVLDWALDFVEDSRMVPSSDFGGLFNKRIFASEPGGEASLQVSRNGALLTYTNFCFRNLLSSYSVSSR